MKSVNDLHVLRESRHREVGQEGIQVKGRDSIEEGPSSEGRILNMVIQNPNSSEMHPSEYKYYQNIW